MLFCMYMLPLDKIISGYCINYHGYADDTQLYMPLQPNDPSQIKKLEACVCHIKRWMCRNFPFLNAAKTDLVVIRPTNHKHLSENLFLSHNGFMISASSNLKNLGIFFIRLWLLSLILGKWLKQHFFICATYLSLSFRNAETLLHSLVSCRLDYCNSFFIFHP